MSSVVLVAIGGSLLIPLLAGRGTRASNIRTAPNQGIHTSIRNGLRLGVIGVPFCVTTFWLTALVLPDDRLFGTFPGWQLLAVHAAFGYFGGFLIIGGGEAIHHYLLRLTLHLQGRLPLNLARFCNHAAALILLQRAGGGWLPIHGEFQRHLAARAAAPDVST